METKSYKILRKLVLSRSHRIGSYAGREYLKLLEPIDIFTEDTKKYLEELKLEGFILSGGNNVNPNLYNSSEIMGDVFEQRDKTEKCVMDYAIEKKLPVFGICRGFEFINVYFKGKLSKVDAKTHIAKIHEIKVSNEKKNINIIAASPNKDETIKDSVVNYSGTNPNFFPKYSP